MFSLGAAYEVLLIDDCCGYLPLTKQTYTLKVSKAAATGPVDFFFEFDGNQLLESNQCPKKDQNDEVPILK